MPAIELVKVEFLSMTETGGVAHAVLSHNSTSNLQLVSDEHQLVFDEPSEKWGTGSGHSMNMEGLTPDTDYTYTWTFTATGMQPLTINGVVTHPPAAKQATTTGSGSAIVVGSGPGDAVCLDLTNHQIGFGGVSDSHWKQWIPSLRYSIGEEFLAVEDTANYGKVLRHKYVPSSIGSGRVVTASSLNLQRTYRLAQSIYLEPGWDWGQIAKKGGGGKLGFGLGGGTTPSGGTVDPNGFTARLMWRGQSDGTAKIGIYSYAADRTKTYGEDVLIDNYAAPIGEWINIIIEIQTNSSTSSYDGRMRIWLDGVQVLDKQNVGWQLGGSTPAVDSLYYSSFYGGSSAEWGPYNTTYAKMRNVCWSSVVNGYSGIDPDNGRYEVFSTVNPGTSYGDDPWGDSGAPDWFAKREEAKQLAEASRVQIEFLAPDASEIVGLYYAQAVEQLILALNATSSNSVIDLASNPIPAIRAGLR